MASRTKRIMRDFTLREISCVDRPAQKGAMATLMKRGTTMDHHDVDDILEAARGIQKRDGVSGLEALKKARREIEFDPDEATDAELGKNAFEVACTEIMKRDDCSRLEAMKRAREEQPALYHFWNTGDVPEEVITKAHPKDTASWANVIEGIKNKEGCGGTEAARRARRRYPELHANMQKNAPEVTKDLAMPSPKMIGGETAKADWDKAVAAI